MVKRLIYISGKEWAEKQVASRMFGFFPNGHWKLLNVQMSIGMHGFLPKGHRDTFGSHRIIER